ncbi:MAG: DUF58 domain-containing protein [Halothiobacillaceae bacterium]|nr:DUF58 domain-containing protein [Halothiobacillaceae bacterium]HER35228.1 DUF58 domain-containing protein [Halothiobacillaceae bacterium]
MLAITVAMLVAAINYGNNLIFLFAFATLALIVNSAWQGWRALGSLRIEPLPPAMRPAGSAGDWPLRLSGRPAGPGLPAVGLSIDDSTVELSLPPGDERTAWLTLPPAPRGYLAMPTVRVFSRFPLGLWEIEYRLVPQVGQWLHPAPLEGMNPSDPVEESSTNGQLCGDGDPTHLRAYQPGDPLRRIVFRHYAKTGRLVSRHTEAVAATEKPTIIDYERYRGDREIRLSAMTARLIERADAGRPWALHLPGNPTITSDGGPTAQRAYRQALCELARFGRPRDAAGFDRLPSIHEARS